MKQSLGLLEVSDLALAINCADVMARATSVTLVGLKKTNGSDWTVTKIIGDVASVQAAISTGASFVGRQDGLVAYKVISRSGDGILSHSAVLRPEPMPELVPTVPHEEIFVVHDVLEVPQDTELISYSLCLDPARPHRKGGLRILCLHSGKRDEV